jgi:TnpA family transposase
MKQLEITLHTTDTARYTELNFALFDPVGLEFAPRIKDLKDQNLYSTNNKARYKNIKP